jgi:hypothetical protein
MDAFDLLRIIFFSIFAMGTVVMIIVALRMVKEAKAVKSGDLVELAKLAKLAESAQSSNATSWFGSTLIGLIPFSIGIFIAALTIHLYVNGIETMGTIKSVHGSSVNRYVLVSYQTQTGVTQALVWVKRNNATNTGKKVKVVYLPTFPPIPPIAAIRGYADVRIIILLPLILIFIGSLFIGLGVKSWGERKNDAINKESPFPVIGAKSWGKRKNDAINEESSFSVVDKIIIISILGIIITIFSFNLI